MNRSLTIVSGGQTGADRGALDAAMGLGLDVDGWCPRGRRAEDGRVPKLYPLHETPSGGYVERTVWNVRDSDATLILHSGRTGPGTMLTVRTAGRLSRAYLVVDVREPASVRMVKAWIDGQKIGRLNVAGPRESGSPGLQDAVRIFLTDVLRGMTTR
jgi:hypothetical protein